MTTKKIVPAANEAPKEKKPDSTLIDLAEDYYQTWLPALSIESSKFLGKRLSITQAEVNLIIRDNEVLRASCINLHQRVLHLEKMCTDLCRKNNQCYHSLIKIKEGHNKFIDETNAKLKRAGF
jgi:hypothetical protein